MKQTSVSRLFRILLLTLALAALLLCAVACGEDVTDAGTPADSSAEPVETEQVFEPDVEGFTIPENVVLSEEEILASASEAWALNQGGTDTVIPSAIGKTNAENTWGVWLKNQTFGYALDFSAEGSRAVIKDSQVDVTGPFAVSAWVKAPIREQGERVIIAQEPASTYEYTDRVFEHSMDEIGDWTSTVDLTIDTENYKEGTGALRAELKQKGDLCINLVHKGLNVSDYVEDGYLHFWIYAENKANAKNGQLELTSSGGPDKNEAFYMSTAFLKEGQWNEVYLRLNTASSTGGDVNPARFNFMRLYFNSDGPLTVLLDDIYICHRRLVQSDVNDGWRLFLNEAGELDFSATGFEGIESSGCNLVDGRWHHVMTSYNGSDFIYYIDGTAVKACAVTGTISTATNDLLIGSNGNLTGTFDGSIAEVRLFNAAKTPGETTATVLNTEDNAKKGPYMDLKHGCVMDRRQYYGSDSRVLEPGAVVHDQDIAAIKNMGFDHVKLLLTPNHLIAEDGSLKVEEMEYITWVIGHVINNDFRCILCLHPESPFKETYLGDLDSFELLIKWYGEFAQYVGEHWPADRVAIQLMTEPYANNGAVSWSWMSDRMWGAVRNVLPDHTILTSSDSSGNLERLKLMSPATDDNLIYTFTTYEPYTVGFAGFSSNGNMWSYIHDVPYPIEEGVDYTEAIENAIADVPDDMKADARTVLTDYVNGESDNGKYYVNHYDCLYNAEWHMLRAKSLHDWSEKYGGNIHIMCVEFGCSDGEQNMSLFGAKYYGVTDETRKQFITDMRTAFDTYDIGWSYWSYCEAFTLLQPKYAIRYSDKWTADTIAQVVDYPFLEEALGVTPLVRPEGILDEDALQGWALNENGEETSKSLVTLGAPARYVGTSSVAYADAYATVLNGDGSYVIAEDTGIALGRSFTIAADVKADNTGAEQVIVSQAEGMWEDPEYVGKFMVADLDDSTGMWGTGAIEPGTAEPVQGAGYVQSSSDNLIVFCKAWTDPLDLSAYKNGGKVYISVYVEDASKLVAGTTNLEICSDTQLSTGVNWVLPDPQNGWNTYELDFAKVNRDFKLDYSNIAMFRFFVYTKEMTTVGIDNFFVCMDGDLEPVINWELIVNEAGELEFKSDSYNGLGTSGTVVADGQWHKVIASYDGQNLTYYVDGKNVASVKTSGVMSEVTGTSDTFIGANSAHKSTLSGSVANVMIFSGAKTPDDLGE